MRVLNVLSRGLPLVMLLLCGCSTAPFADWDKTVFSPSYWHSATDKAPQPTLRQQIEKSLAADDLKRAHRLILSDRQSGADNSQWHDLNRETFNRLVSKARLARKQSDPGRAGRFFRLAEEIYPAAGDSGAAHTVSALEIRTEVESCSRELMLSGLSAYRSGELDLAVEIWQEIERFNPEHTPSRLAIRTAKIQKEKLDRLTVKTGD